MDAPIDLRQKQRGGIPQPAFDIGGQGITQPAFAVPRQEGSMGVTTPDDYSQRRIGTPMPNVTPQPEKMNDYSSYLDFYNNKNFMPVGNNPPQMGSSGEGGDGQGGVSQPAFEIQPGGMGGSSGLIGKLQEPSQNYNSNFSFEQPTRTANQEMMSGEVERLSRENMMAHDQQNENLKQAVQGGFGMPPAQINQLGPTNPMEFPQQPSAFGVEPFYRDHRGGVPQQPLMRTYAGRFYSGGITDLYPR